MTDVVGRLSTALSDRYAIDREIGVGGMATVYLARDLKHDRLVALKLLRPELGAVIGAERFLAEIKLTANLQHPHILPLFDSGVADELLYYVMPYVEGVSLRHRLQREKQLPIQEAVRIASEVASALDYAHRQGVIHRDIKPENILLHDGQALVADFGIALALSGAGNRMTGTGMSLGTPHYMSPEQAMGEREISAASDVYALGAVTYEMLVGEPPFTGPTAQAIVSKVITDNPRPLLPQRHTIPAHVEAAILTSLEKLPADRFASAAEFGQALRTPGFTGARAMESTSTVVAGMPWARTRPAAVAFGAVALALVAVVAFVGGRLSGDRRAPTNGVGRFVVPTGGDHRLAGAAFNSIALSPNAKTLVYMGQSARGIQLYRRRLDELTSAPIAGTENAVSPFFTPDGQWITFFTSNAIRKVSVEGGSPVPVSTAGLTPQAAIWLDDHTLAMTGQDGKLYRVTSDGTKTVIASPNTPAGENALLVADMLPGGRNLLVIAAPGAGISGRLFAVDMKSGTRTLVVDQVVSGAGFDAGHLAWVQQDGTLLAAAFDAKRLRFTSAPVTLAQRVRLSVGGPPHFHVSRNGALVYVPEMPFELMLVDRQGKAQPISNLQRRFHSPRFSPDGRRLAVDFTQQGSRDVWTMDLQEQTLSRLTFDDDGHDPVWTPDGRKVAYATARAGVIGMFLRDADGTGAAESLYVGPTAQTVGAFPPRGDRAIVISTGTASSFDLSTIPLTAGGAPQAFLSSPFLEAYPAISPDGRWLAYVSDESGQSEVYVRPFPGPGPKVTVSQNGGSEPVWSRNGRELFYFGFGREGAPLMALGVQTAPSFRVTSRTPLFDVSEYEAGNPHANYDVGPDGRFVMVHQGRLSEIVVVQNWAQEIRQRGSAPATP